MLTFQQASTPVPAGAGAFTWANPDGWQQGRGSFGGLVLAAATRAVRHVAGPTGAPLRSLTAQLLAPALPGPIHIEVNLLRSGSSLAAYRADLRAEDATLVATATLVLAHSRPDSPRWQTLSPPVMPAWADRAPVQLPIGVAPVFTQHFDLWPEAPYPFSRASSAHAAGWVRVRQDVPRDEALLVALADCYWPAALAVFAAPRPTATVTYMLDVIEPWSDADHEAPVFHRGFAPSAQDGYSSETRELWSVDGRLLARNHQTFVIIK